jgi:hypothetical protein
VNKSPEKIIPNMYLEKRHMGPSTKVGMTELERK